MIHAIRHSCLQQTIKPIRQRSVLPILSSQTPCLIACTNSSSSSTHTVHDHSRIWSAEKVLAAGLLGLFPAAFFFPNPAFDHALALVITAHIHWGIEAIVIDYIRPSVVGATLSRAAMVGVYFLTAFTLGGLFYFNYSDVGLIQAVKMLWKL